MPQGPFVEERHEFHSTEDEREAMTAAVTQRGGMVVKRRKLLGGLFALGSTAMGIVLLFPLLRSLGPKPAKSEKTHGPTADSLFTTNWRKGSQLVTVDGRKVTRRRPRRGRRAHRLPPGLRRLLARPGHPDPPGQQDRRRPTR